MYGRTEQQFHPEIYKSTKCNDIQNTSYCPRGAFCAFAHLEQESLESGPEGGPNFADILTKALPDSDSCDSQSDRSSCGELGELQYCWGEGGSLVRAPASLLLSHLTPGKQSPPGLLDTLTHSIPPSPTYHKIRTSSGDTARKHLLMGESIRMSYRKIKERCRRRQKHLLRIKCSLYLLDELCMVEIIKVSFLKYPVQNSQLSAEIFRIINCNLVLISVIKFHYFCNFLNFLFPTLSGAAGWQEQLLCPAQTVPTIYPNSTSLILYLYCTLMSCRRGA